MKRLANKNHHISLAIRALWFGDASEDMPAPAAAYHYFEKGK
jgi:hypothetical protein